MHTNHQVKETLNVKKSPSFLRLAKAGLVTCVLTSHLNLALASPALNIAPTQSSANGILSWQQQITRPLSKWLVDSLTFNEKAFQVGIPFTNWSISVEHSKQGLYLKLINDAYKSSSKQAHTQLDKTVEIKKKKQHQTFEEQLIARQNLSAQHALKMSEKYAQLYKKAYALGEKTYPVIEHIEAIASQPIQHRQAFQTGFEKGQFSYNLHSNNTTTPTRYRPYRQLNDQALIEADKKEDKDQLSTKR